MKAACPQCGSGSLELTEHWHEAQIVFKQEAGRIVDHWQNDNPDPYKVVARCGGCNHRWRLRGVTQIADVESYDFRSPEP